MLSSTGSGYIDLGGRTATVEDLGLYFIAGTVILGLVSLILISLRLWQLLRGRLGAVRATLSPSGQLISALGFVGLSLAGLGWLTIPAGFLYCPPWQPLCESVAFMPLLVLAPGYLFVEILLLPITWRQIRKRPNQTTDA
jgi:hypothetical protein